MASQSANLNDLLQTAKDRGVVTPAQSVMITDLGAQIQAGLGITPDDVTSSSTLLVGSIIDNSRSIAGIDGGPEAVCMGQNLYLNAFQHSRQKNSFFVGTWLVNQNEPIQAFSRLDGAIMLTNGQNYHARGDTPLYRRTCAVLSTMYLKMKVEFVDAGLSCRGFLLVVTDGRDEDYEPGQRVYTAEDCRSLIERMGESLTVQFMGIKGNKRVDYHQIAREMGVKPEHIMTPDATEQAIRRAFELSSEAAIRVSQQAGLGGFGTP